MTPFSIQANLLPRFVKAPAHLWHRLQVKLPLGHLLQIFRILHLRPQVEESSQASAKSSPFCALCSIETTFCYPKPKTRAKVMTLATMNSRRETLTHGSLSRLQLLTSVPFPRPHQKCLPKAKDGRHTDTTGFAPFIPLTLLDDSRL